MKSKNFNERCYSLLIKVPKGKVTTYKFLAEALGTKAYRAVGNAMNKNPYGAWGRAGGSPLKSELVSCHRVVCSDGKVGGFAAGTPAKIKLLKSEGIEVLNGEINLKEYLFKFN
ncbi:MAG: MGMT family protein [Nanoarchaeota archaeon]|nr:MGMT family protein [Nanoarchaeota archaeon]